PSMSIFSTHSESVSSGVLAVFACAFPLPISLTCLADAGGLGSFALSRTVAGGATLTGAWGADAACAERTAAPTGRDAAVRPRVVPSFFILILLVSRGLVRELLVVRVRDRELDALGGQVHDLLSGIVRPVGKRRELDVQRDRVRRVAEVGA